MKGIILEYLSDTLNVWSLSDLRLERMRPQVIRMLLDIDNTLFSVDEWNYTFGYIFGDAFHFEQVEQAKAFVCEKGTTR